MIIIKKIKNKTSKVSIITPTFNSEKFLEETLKSIVGQTYKNYELIIIDGKSTDQTLKIINAFRFAEKSKFPNKKELMRDIYR